MSRQSWHLPCVRVEPRFCAGLVMVGTGLLLVFALLLWSASPGGVLAVWPALACIVGRQLWRQNRYCGAHRLQSLAFERNGWSLMLADGRRLVLEMRPGPLLHPALLAARFRVGTGGWPDYSLVLVASALDRESWRRLQLALRHAQEAAGASTVSTAV